MIRVITSILRFVFRSTLLALFIGLLLVPFLWLANYYQGLATEQSLRKTNTIKKRLTRCLLWFFGININVRGLPADAPLLVAANHISWLDILVLHSVRTMGFVAKAEIDNWPLFSLIARTGGTIFHQRGSHGSATDVIATMVARLKQGQRVAVFPEGGIVPGTSVRVFHARMFRAAVEAECPVQPVMVRYLVNGCRDGGIQFREGENLMRNIGRLLARPGAEADVNFLPLIDATEKPRRALAEAARAAIMSSYDD